MSGHISSSIGAINGPIVAEGGDLSGASQPHKHIQLIPIEEDGPPIEKTARAVTLEVAGRHATIGSCSS